MPDRKHPSANHVHWRRGRPNILFVTACVKGHRELIACEPAVEVFRRAWLEADHWTVGRYLLMPDHVHFFCADTGRTAFEVWIRYWKRLVSQAWPDERDLPLWQSQVWDTQMRDGNHYDAKWRYVQENPVRKGLVENAEDWPFKGDIAELWF